VQLCYFCGNVAIFGAIHCIAWSFEIPSPTEQLLWCISSLTISFVPLLLLAMGWLTAFSDWDNLNLPEWLTAFSNWINLPMWLLQLFLGIPFISLTFLYFLACGILLVVAFMSLVSLPSDAYQTVNWTTFIPHI